MKDYSIRYEKKIWEYQVYHQFYQKTENYALTEIRSHGWKSFGIIIRWIIFIQGIRREVLDLKEKNTNEIIFSTQRTKFQVISRFSRFSRSHFKFQVISRFSRFSRSPGNHAIFGPGHFFRKFETVTFSDLLKANLMQKIRKN